MGDKDHTTVGFITIGFLLYMVYSLSFFIIAWIKWNLSWFGNLSFLNQRLLLASLIIIWVVTWFFFDRGD